MSEVDNATWKGRHLGIIVANFLDDYASQYIKVPPGFRFSVSYDRASEGRSSGVHSIISNAPLLSLLTGVVNRLDEISTLIMSTPDYNLSGIISFATHEETRFYGGVDVLEEAAASVNLRLILPFWEHTRLQYFSWLREAGLPYDIAFQVTCDRYKNRPDYLTYDLQALHTAYDKPVPLDPTIDVGAKIIARQWDKLRRERYRTLVDTEFQSYNNADAARLQLRTRFLNI